MVMRKNSSLMWRSSASLDFKKLRRAGTLKNRFFTVKLVPTEDGFGSCSMTFEPSMRIFVPTSSSFRRVVSSTCATAAIEASASPRNPMVFMAKRSSAHDIFDVACRSKHSRASVSDMPQPLSMTVMNVRPASFTMRSTCVAPASIAFSMSSLTTDAGRWMTSPAAIWLATESGSNLMISNDIATYLPSSGTSSQNSPETE